MRGAAVRTSVVIPAYRGWSTLPAVLVALGPQLGPERKAILVESGTEGPSSELRQRWPWLRMLTTAQRLLPGEALNLGATVARGEWLALLDADAERFEALGGFSVGLRAG